METFDYSEPTRPTIPKDPGATLDYVFPWGEWLAADGDSLATATVTQTGGLTIGAVNQQPSGDVAVWVSGGTLGGISTVTCRITTAGGRADERTIYLRIRNR